MPPSRIAFALADALDEIERTAGPVQGSRTMRLMLDRQTFDAVASGLKDRFGVPVRLFLHPLGEVDGIIVRSLLVCCSAGGSDGGSG